MICTESYQSIPSQCTLEEEREQERFERAMEHLCNFANEHEDELTLDASEETIEQWLESAWDTDAGLDDYEKYFYRDFFCPRLMPAWVTNNFVDYPK